MKLIGAHISIAKGLYTVQKQMDILKCETCAIFLKNQRRFKSSELNKLEIEKFKEAVKNPEVILPHGSYLINLANPESFEKNMECFLDDLKRCNQLGIKLYNFHPGSDVKKLGTSMAVKHIANNLNKAIEVVPEVIICIENMAGQGNVIGRTFEELGMIIKEIKDKERIGITLDTCHLFAGGYDIRTEESFEKVMKEFDAKVGLKYLKGMHLNDSKAALGSRVDRHESIGKGMIGLDAFKYIMGSSYFEDIPMILETPDPEKYKSEIELLKSFIK
jgi:deoxyribonuclease-4